MFVLFVFAVISDMLTLPLRNFSQFLVNHYCRRCLPIITSHFRGAGYVAGATSFTAKEKDDSKVDDEKSTKQDITAVLDREVEQQLDSGSVDVFTHPGKRRIEPVELPPFLELSSRRAVSRFLNQQFRIDADRMRKRVRHLQLPAEPEDFQERRRVVTEKVIANEPDIDFNMLTDDERQFLLEKRKKKIGKLLSAPITQWKEIIYDTDYACAVYLGARLGHNYAVLMRVLNEIKKTDPSFTPKTLFDFGSGIGTTMFAANQTWPNSISEHMNIDISKKMHDLCRLVLSGGDDSQPMLYNGVYFKEYLPLQSHIKYDLVVSAFTLMELPSRAARVHAIESLWQKTGDIMVVVEIGSNEGFRVINEVRSQILDMSGYDVTKSYYTQEETGATVYDPYNAPTAHILAPCPHHLACPRQFTGGPILCQFEVKFKPFDIGEKNSYDIEGTPFSYIILRKGQELLPSERSKWPRINQPVLKKGGHVICRACCPDGSQRSVTLSRAKHKGWMYKVARASQWGDLLPATVVSCERPLSFWDKVKRQNYLQQLQQEKEGEKKNDDES